MTIIRKAAMADIPDLDRVTSDDHITKEEGYFEKCLAEQDAGRRDIFVVIDREGQLCGYCHYQRRPGYLPFRSLGVHEIQDLYIAPNARRNGYATALIEHCCRQACTEGQDLMGIAVGLSSNYGKAQRLYFKLGFEPDGGGIVYDRIPVIRGQHYPVDDELCLMMIKRLD